MLKIILLMMTIAVALSGCSTSDHGKAKSGGAVYNYKHSVTPEGVESCEVNITSAREVLGGDIKIGKGCEIESKADTAGGAADAIRVFSKMADKIPSVPTP